jgi:hypothetical protein
MQVVLQKYDVKQRKNRTEAVVMNRRRSLIQASDWDEGQKELQECLRRFAKLKSRRYYYSLPVTYGIVAIEYRLKDGSVPDNPALHTLSV